MVRRVSTGLEAGDAHLGSLLDHIVEPRALERGEQVVDVGSCLLRPHLLADGKHRGALAAFGNAGLPFAVAAVEDEDAVAGLEPQHVAQIVGLGGCACNVGAFAKIGIDEQALGGKIVAAHVPTLQPDP